MKRKPYVYGNILFVHTTEKKYLISLIFTFFASFLFHFILVPYFSFKFIILLLLLALFLFYVIEKYFLRFRLLILGINGIPFHIVQRSRRMMKRSTTFAIWMLCFYHWLLFNLTYKEMKEEERKRIKGSRRAIFLRIIFTHSKKKSSWSEAMLKSETWKSAIVDNIRYQRRKWKFVKVGNSWIGLGGYLLTN